MLRRFGHDVEVLDGPAMRAEVASPTYRAGIWDRTGTGLLDPARLADGLRAAAARLGVRIFEGTPAEALEPRGDGIDVRTPHGRSARVACCWPRARSRRSCARSAATSCPSTTTRS